MWHEGLSLTRLVVLPALLAEKCKYRPCKPVTLAGKQPVGGVKACDSLDSGGDVVETDSIRGRWRWENSSRRLPYALFMCVHIRDVLNAIESRWVGEGR